MSPTFLFCLLMAVPSLLILLVAMFDRWHSRRLEAAFHHGQQRGYLHGRRDERSHWEQEQGKSTRFYTSFRN